MSEVTPERVDSDVRIYLDAAWVLKDAIGTPAHTAASRAEHAAWCALDRPQQKVAEDLLKREATQRIREWAALEASNG